MAAACIFAAQLPEADAADLWYRIVHVNVAVGPSLPAYQGIKAHPPSSQNLQPTERMASRTSNVSEALMPC